VVVVLHLLLHLAHVCWAARSGRACCHAAAYWCACAGSATTRCLLGSSYPMGSTLCPPPLLQLLLPGCPLAPAPSLAALATMLLLLVLFHALLPFLLLP
jgi:hypothetical protein